MSQQDDSAPGNTPQALQQSISTLTRQLAERAAAGRPMRASLQGAYRTVLDRELVRLGKAAARPPQKPAREG